MSLRNRGPASGDLALFHDRWRSVFHNAASDLSWLLSKGYAISGALQLVGNQYRLNKRQRLALRRMSVATQDILNRTSKVMRACDLRNRAVAIDGFNQLILIEGALSGAFIFKCQDGIYRDISGVHGSYKRVTQTDEAIALVGKVLQKFGVKEVEWVLDQPISNSGRLKKQLLHISKNHDFSWSVLLTHNPDRYLSKSEKVVITSDGEIIDHARQWYNLMGYLIRYHLDNVRLFVPK